MLSLTENEDKLLWNPGLLSIKEVEEYLAKSQETVQSGGVGSLPLGAHVRDDEQVMFSSVFGCELSWFKRLM